MIVSLRYRYERTMFLVVVVVVNHCFTSLFGTIGILSDIVVQIKRCSQLKR